MVSKRYVFLWLFGLLLLSSVAIANIADSACPINIPVASRSTAVFQQALRQALQTALVQLSGNPAIMTIPQIQNQLPKANDFLLRYSYQSSPLTLHLVFNQQALIRLLQNAGQTVWRDQRPLTLVIMLISHEGDWSIMSDESPWVVKLKQLTTQQRLPILLPIADLQDQALIFNAQHPDLSASYRQPLMQRYQVNNILYGIIKPSTGGEVGQPQQVSWHLWSGNNRYEWLTSGVTIEEAVSKGFDHLLETLAGQYAYVEDSRLQTRLLLKISGVKGLTDYVQVIKYLKKLAPVGEVMVKDMAKNSVLLQVDVAGGEEALQHAVQRDPALIFQEAISIAGGEKNVFQYQWQQPGIVK